MGKFTVEKWRCDRCHAVADRWLKPGSAHSVVASVDYGTAGGRVIEWREMCDPCNREVGEQIDAMKKAALAARPAKETDNG